jgi:hypothetical protein
MIATNEEKICGSDFGYTGVNGLSSEARLRGGNGGFKQSHLPDSARTAELAYGLSMNLKHDSNREMINVTAGLRAHARRRIVRA